MWSYSLPAVTLVLAVAAIATALRAVQTARTPQGAVGWVVFIFALPVLGIPLFLLLGNLSRRRYAIRRQEADRRLALRHRAAVQAGHAPGRLAVFEALAGQRAESGSTADLLIDGAATYAALHAAIADARRYVLVQMYLIRDDAEGHRFADALIDRAQAGVRVCLGLGAFRGASPPRAMVARLRAGGVQVHHMRGPRRPFGRFHVNYRNHRKIVVVDGTTGFTGGLNIGCEYLGQDPGLGAWRDTFLRLGGPMVSDLQHVFVRDWAFAGGGNLASALDWEPPAQADGITGLILPGGPTDRLETGTLHFCALAGAARRRLWIATPYLVPDTDVLSALKLAALRGVEVRILIPDRADHWLPWLAAHAYLDELRRAGVEIWRYTAGFLHQKVALVDDDLCSVGSYNLDIRSMLLNYEVTAMFDDHTMADRVATMLQADFARARREQTWLEDQPLRLRLAAPAARLMAPLL